MKMKSRPEPGAFGEAWELLFSPPVAHRGLWTPGGAPENSLAAFQAACVAGYGIELDVQLTADGEAVVFHDYSLDRMTGEEGRLADRALHDLRDLRLAGTDETIPTLAEVLVEVGHRALVHIELKTKFGEVGPLEKRVSEVLLDHHGPTCVIGFNPYSHAWFADHHPQILRGLDSYDWKDGAASKLTPEIRQAYANLRPTPISNMSSSPGPTSWRWTRRCCPRRALTCSAQGACRSSPGRSVRPRSGSGSATIAII